MEIKFRGKRVDNGEWVYGDLLTDMKSQPAYIREKERGGFSAAVVRADTFKIIPETVGQRVGVSDKNGNDYYHGDIFRLDSWTTPINEIVYNRGGFCFRHSKEDMYYSDIKYAEEGVKIGNVFDNLDLLK